MFSFFKKDSATAQPATEIVITDIIPLTPDNKEKAIEWINADELVVTASEIAAMKMSKNGHDEYVRAVRLEPDAPEKGKLVRAWQRQINGQNQPQIITLHADLVENGPVRAWVPTQLTRTAGAPFLIFYRMPCCDGLSLFASFGPAGNERVQTTQSAQAIAQNLAPVFDHITISLPPPAQG